MNTVRALFLPGADAACGATPPVAVLGRLLPPLQPLTLTFLFHQDTDAKVSIYLSAQFPSSNEQMQLLRESLIRIEGQVDFDCIIDPPQERIEYLTSPAARLAVVPEPPLLPSGRLLAYVLSLHQVVGSLLEQARVHGISLTYRLELTFREADTAFARNFIPALAELKRMSSAVIAIERALEEVISLSRNSGWSAAESFFLSQTDAPTHGHWMESTIRQYIAAMYPFITEELVSLAWSESRPSDPEPHSYEINLSGRGAMLRAPEYLLNALRDIADDESGSLLALPFAARRHLRRSEACGPPYAFISYARQDNVLLQMVVELLDKVGVRFWFDSSIDPGNIWDETLEQKIRDCAIFIACLSDEYGCSKYCRREIKFADLVARPIIPVAIGQFMWPTGLAMMFQELQIVAIEVSVSKSMFIGSLQRMAPDIMTHPNSN